MLDIDSVAPIEPLFTPHNMRSCPALKPCHRLTLYALPMLPSQTHLLCHWPRLTLVALPAHPRVIPNVSADPEDITDWINQLAAQVLILSLNSARLYAELGSDSREIQRRDERCG